MIAEENELRQASEISALPLLKREAAAHTFQCKPPQ